MRDPRNTPPYLRLQRRYRDLPSAIVAIDQTIYELTHLQHAGEQHTRRYNTVNRRRARLALLIADYQQLPIL
jgi:hypothetical protein